MSVCKVDSPSQLEDKAQSRQSLHRHLSSNKLRPGVGHHTDDDVSRSPLDPRQTAVGGTSDPQTDIDPANTTSRKRSASSATALSSISRASLQTTTSQSPSGYLNAPLAAPSRRRGSSGLGLASKRSVVISRKTTLSTPQLSSIDSSTIILLEQERNSLPLEASFSSSTAEGPVVAAPQAAQVSVDGECSMKRTFADTTGPEGDHSSSPGQGVRDVAVSRSRNTRRKSEEGTHSMDVVVRDDLDHPQPSTFSATAHPLGVSPTSAPPPAQPTSQQPSQSDSSEAEMDQGKRGASPASRPAEHPTSVRDIDSSPASGQQQGWLAYLTLRQRPPDSHLGLPPPSGESDRSKAGEALQAKESSEVGPVSISTAQEDYLGGTDLQAQDESPVQKASSSAPVAVNTASGRSRHLLRERQGALLICISVCRLQASATFLMVVLACLEQPTDRLGHAGSVSRTAHGRDHSTVFYCSIGWSLDAINRRGIFRKSNEHA